MKAAEKMAQTVYKAKPDRFKVEEQVRIRHGTISSTTPNAREKLTKSSKLASGAEFAAWQKSLQTLAALPGGDLGFFPRANALSLKQRRLP